MANKTHRNTDPLVEHRASPMEQYQVPRVRPPRRHLSPEGGATTAQTPAIRDLIHAHAALGQVPHTSEEFTRSSSASTLIDEPTTAMPSDIKYVSVPTSSKRKYETKRILLTNGNLVVDQDVPDRLRKLVPRREEEFTKMRYTAVTCEPDEFVSQGYQLRQQEYNRRTELFIVMTMYNEDEVLFARTIDGVMENIAHLCSLENSDMWGPEGWKKVVVSIVADGRKMIDKRVLNLLAGMGVYQSGVAKNLVDDKPVTAHIYEFTTQISIDPKTMKFRRATDKNTSSYDSVPVQIIFCLKEKNAKKINSHRWFFNALGPCLQPEVCVLLDVGTRPDKKSIHELWKTFNDNPTVGGACGEIRAMLGRGHRHLLNPLVASQNFEYKMSNILDKPMESVFGYISVLPGAFSAYRYKALQNDINGKGPLQKYFHGEQRHEGLFEANMYLAEDRILCFELVAKQNERWILKYCDKAFAETDVPDSLPEFISQRRRWLNGSFFAGVYGLLHFPSIFKSQHTVGRIILLCLEGIYNIFSLIFSWLALANFYITFYFITKSLSDEQMDPFGNGWGGRIFDVFKYVYLFTVVVVIICSLGNRPQGSKILFSLCTLVFACIMVYMLFASCWIVYKTIDLAWAENSGHTLGLLLENSGMRNLIVSLLATYGLYLVSSLLYCDPWHMITSFVPYILLLPSYVNILTIYAFCNTHDVSWGTKGDNTISKDLGVVTVLRNEKRAEAEIVLPAEQRDIDLEYDEALLEFEMKKKSAPTSEKQTSRTQDDYYRSFRTHLVLMWIACNVILVSVITSTEYSALYIPSIGNNYLMAILWVNAGLAMFRFVGSCGFLLQGVIARI